MAILTGLALTIPLLAYGQTQQNGGFVGRETRELVAICTVGSLEPGYVDARAFCHGYLTGAYSAVLAARPRGARTLHCNLPESRQEPIDRFIAWANARPAMLAEFPPNAFMRFMDETYACPRR